MVFSEILIKAPYNILWQLNKFKNKNKLLAFFCSELLDYEIFRNVHKYIPKIQIISKNRKIAKLLQEKYGLISKIYPAYPDVVIMSRHSLHFFPCKKIIKIGMRHGAYHFKNFISPEKYNRFDLFFFTSHKEVEEAKEIGINNAEYGGFPKCDTLFDENFISSVVKNKGNLIDVTKKTILFSSTWDKSGLSGVHFWFDKLGDLVNKYNIVVTLHPWVDKLIANTIKTTEGVKLISSDEIYKYILLADAFVADTSSIIAEFMLSNKPIFTFRLPVGGRLSYEIFDLLEKNTIRVNNFDELREKIDLYSKKTEMMNYDKCLELFFSNNFGKHSEIMAKKIKDFLKQKGIEI